MSSGKLLQVLRGEYLDGHAGEFDRVTSQWCESPIESLFAGALLAGGWEVLPGRAWYETYNGLSAHSIKPSPTLLGSELAGFSIVLQAEVVDASGLAGKAALRPLPPKYRIDFAFVSDSWLPSQVRLAVELDGHDFHERTKEQAQRDKARDRWLTSRGWRVLRFTGSEVFRDAKACADEALRVMTALVDLAEQS